MTETQATPASPQRRPSRAVFLLPALLTLGNIFLGFFAIVKAIDGRFALAAGCVVFAALLDKFDGLVARKTGTVSDFGKELDSLADVISFGMAPALIAFTWGLGEIPKLGWAICFLFLTSGTLRLARFNVQASSLDRRWFAGLPTPAAAGVPVSLVLLFSTWHPEGAPPAAAEPWLVWLLLVVMAMTSFLMVSTFRYASFKDVRVERQRWLPAFVGLFTLIVALANWPGISLVVIALTYAASGPALKLWSLVRRRSAAQSEPAPEPAGESS